MSDKQTGKAVLVLGMHRSGTSALMRVINLLGADIGTDLLPPAADNPSGFWEHGGVVRIHDDLLVALGRSWHDVRALPSDWLSGEAAAVARMKLIDLLGREFSTSALWAVKDPRLCRLLPLWHQVLVDLNVEGRAIFVVRHPDEVAKSLLIRDKIPAAFTRLSWVEHMVEAELASRNIPRVATSYEDLLADWPKALRRVTEELSIQWPVTLDDASPAINEFLQKGARHHAIEPANRALPKLAQRTYDAFIARARSEGSDWQEVQHVSDSYVASSELFLEGIEETTAQVIEKDSDIHSLKGRIETLCSASREIAAHTFLHGAHVDAAAVGDFAKIYYRQDDEYYAEERSVRIPHQGLWTATLFTFELPLTETPDFIRFDPSEFPGEFAIRKLHVNGQLVHYMDGRFSLMGTHVVAITDDELRMASMDSDPHVEMDLRSLKRSSDDAAVLNLTCSRVTPYVELAKLVDDGLVKLEQRRMLEGDMRSAELAAVTQEVESLIIDMDLKTQAVDLAALRHAVDALIGDMDVKTQAADLAALKRAVDTLVDDMNVKMQVTDLSAVKRAVDALVEDMNVKTQAGDLAAVKRAVDTLVVDMDLKSQAVELASLRRVVETLTGDLNVKAEAADLSAIRQGVQTLVEIQQTSFASQIRRAFKRRSSA